jgi:hypothetical protein
VDYWAPSQQQVLTGHSVVYDVECSGIFCSINSGFSKDGHDTQVWMVGKQVFLQQSIHQLQQSSPAWQVINPLVPELSAHLCCKRPEI